MAMYDIIGELGDAQTFTTLTTTEARISENIINLGVDDVNWGNGELWLNIKVATAFITSGTPATTITLRSSSDTTVNVSDKAVITIAAQDLSDLSIGDDVFRGRLPIDVDQEQYIGVLVANATESYTAGALDIWIDHGSQSDFPAQEALSNIT